MDKLFYLTYCATNSLFYVLIKYAHLKYPGYPTYEIAMYTNVISLLLMSVYFFRNIKHVVAGFKDNLRIAISAPSAILKFIAISQISPKNAMVISFLTPIAVTILSFLALKEQIKKSDMLKRYGWMALSFVGVVIFIGPDFTFSTFAYTLMLIHVFGKAFFHIFTKQLSKDRYLVLFYGVLYNLLFSFTVSAAGKGFRVDANMLFNPLVIFIGVFSLLCQFALIQGYKVAGKISLLQNLDYSRILFSSIGAYVFLSEEIKGREWIGMAIIFLSVFGSQIVRTGGKRVANYIMRRKPKKA